MIVELNTSFKKEEKDILLEYYDINIKLFVQTEKLFHVGIKDGEEYSEMVEHPYRMIGVGGLFLLELKDEQGEWYMGEMGKDSTYNFWGCYGDLSTALKSL